MQNDSGMAALKRLYSISQILAVIALSGNLSYLAAMCLAYYISTL